MNIIAEKFKIEVNYNELWKIAFIIKNEIIEKVKTHYIKHQDDWEQY